MLKEMHVQIVLTLSCFLCAKFQDAGEVACCIKSHVHQWIANAAQLKEDINTVLYHQLDKQTISVEQRMLFIMTSH